MLTICSGEERIPKLYTILKFVYLIAGFLWSPSDTRLLGFSVVTLVIPIRIKPFFLHKKLYKFCKFSVSELASRFSCGHKQDRRTLSKINLEAIKFLINLFCDILTCQKITFKFVLHLHLALITWLSCSNRKQFYSELHHKDVWIRNTAAVFEQKNETKKQKCWLPSTYFLFFFLWWCLKKK